jgi:hypothetical protein
METAKGVRRLWQDEQRSSFGRHYQKREGDVAAVQDVVSEVVRLLVKFFCLRLIKARIKAVVNVQWMKQRLCLTERKLLLEMSRRIQMLSKPVQAFSRIQKAYDDDAVRGRLKLIPGQEGTLRDGRQGFAFLFSH